MELQLHMANLNLKCFVEIYIEEFKGKLKKRYAKKTRYDGYSLWEVVDAVGFKNAGAVSKHITKVSEHYEMSYRTRTTKF